MRKNQKHHSGRPSPPIHSCSPFLVPCLLPGARAPVAWPRRRGTTRRRRPESVLFFGKKEVEFFEIARRNPRSIFSLLLPFALFLSLILCPSSSHHPMRRLDPRLPGSGQASGEPDRAKGQGPEQRRSNGEENRGGADAAVERPEMRLPEPVLEFFFLVFGACKERT